MAIRALAGGRLFAEQYGMGAPRLLALHGWGRSHHDFAVALQTLSGLAVDLPGFGASPAPETPMGAAGYARLLAPVFAEFTESPVVVGHSFGGRVAVALAAQAPVKGLLLTGVPLLLNAQRKRPSPSYRLARMAHRFRLLSDARIEQMRQTHGSADYRAAHGVMRQVLVVAVNESYEDEMSGLQVPVRLLWGAEDTEVPLEVAQRALALMQTAGVDVELEMLTGVGHQVPLSAPIALAAAAKRLLDA